MMDRWRLARAAWAGALVAGVLAAPGARAQILTPDADGFHCASLADRLCSTDAYCGTGERCRLFEDARRLCTPDNAIFCCSDAGDCPAARAEEDPTTCSAVSGLSGAGGLCLPDRDYCGAAELADIVACHKSPRGVLVRRWDEGDCDVDGLPNGVENAASTSPCEAPGPVGRVVDGGACAPLPMQCVRSSNCPVNGAPGTCEETGDGAGTFCAPDDEPLYCCGDFVCPDDSDACVPAESASVCVDSTCAGRVLDLLACVTGPGGALVPFAEGDCDGDGVTNGEEIDHLGSDPCADEPPEQDAGAPEDDAGGTGMRQDAGVLRPGLAVRFEGGGGCACRTQPSRGAGAPWLLALASVALARSRRR